MELGQLKYVITATMGELKEKLSQARQAAAQADKEIHNSAEAIKDSLNTAGTEGGSSVSDLASGISDLSPAAGQAVSGINRMKIAMQGLKAVFSPIGVALVALGTAVAALTAYFRGSVEGQERFAKIMAYIGQLGNIVKDAFIELGRRLVNTFEVISNGAKGAALSIAGIFNKEKREEAEKYFQSMRDGIRDFEKMDIINKNALATAKEAVNLAEREFALRKQVMNESIKIAKVETEIAKLRLIANDDAEELSLRLESQGKAIDLIRKKYDIEINQARTRLQIAQQQAELSTNSIEDYEKVAALEVELIGLTTQRDTELRRVVSMYGTISNKIEAVKQAELDAIEKVAEEKRKAFESEMADRSKIMTEIEESYMDEVALTVRRMDEMLAMYDWSLQERYAITKYWLDKINEIEEESTENLKEGFNSVTQMISGSLADAISNLGVAFVDVEAGFKGMVSSVLSGLRQIVTGLLAQAIAGMISKETSSKGILGLATAAIGLTGITALWDKIPQFATGGVVPQGYPNDSYLARLSSGEQIVPAGRTAQLGGNITISGKTYGAEMYWLLENYKSKLGTVT